MKILIINGSPRKGNTWKLTNAVKDDLLSLSLSENIEFEEIHLKDVNLPFCTGCSLCFRKGHQHCPHSLVTQAIMDKIEDCDGLIFSVTSYQMHVPALTKNLTDHFCYMLHRPRYFNKKGLVISTTGGVGVKRTTQFLAGTVRGWGFNRCYELPVRAVSWNDYQLEPNDRKKMQKVSRQFYHDLNSKKLYSPKAGVLIPFNLFRGMSQTYAPGTEYETQDGVYWTKMGFQKNTYATGIPIPIHKKLFGTMFFYLAKIMSKHIMVTYKK